MQDTQNNNEQQSTDAPHDILGSFPKEIFPVMMDLLRQSIKVRLEKLAFDAQEPHDLCYEQSTALESSDTLKQIKDRLQLINEDTCFLYNEVSLLEIFQKLS